MKSTRAFPPKCAQLGKASPCRAFWTAVAPRSEATVHRPRRVTRQFSPNPTRSQHAQKRQRAGAVQTLRASLTVSQLSAFPRRWGDAPRSRCLVDSPPASFAETRTARWNLALPAYPFRPLSPQLSAFPPPVGRRSAEPFPHGLPTRHSPRHERLGGTSPYQACRSPLLLLHPVPGLSFG